MVIRAVFVLLMVYWMSWVTVSLVFPYLYPRIFIPLDWIFRRD